MSNINTELKYFSVVTTNLDNFEGGICCDGIQDAIEEFILSDKHFPAELWFIDTLQVSDDGTFAYCRTHDDSNQRVFIREVCYAEYRDLASDWDVDVDNA